MIVRISSNAAYEILDGEAIILDFESGKYFELNATGTRIFQLIEKHGDLNRVHGEMLAEFDVELDRLGPDLAALVKDLKAKGLIELVES